MTDDTIYSQILDDHYREPRNFGRMEDPDVQVTETNPTCGDTISLFIKVKDGNLAEISYVASGCLISVASASILSEKATGSSLKEIRTMTKSDVLKNLGLKLGPAREKCALISYDALMKAIDRYNSS
ncbi:MAG: iron-sulfur cluster assembly scaffold protein [Candidatus Thermoplasmatota archaeon]|nr:iron-sulfur cluster assembly scaffold protein [Candidatus Thermoplasmatota archaeon]MCL5987338.1 iron-sulfur cluster assembly scaffold protein [Candidatus Thermoplasmatota archaeon]